MSFIAEDNPDIERVLYTSEQIAECVREMGAHITRDYMGKDVLLVCILRGAATFMADLSRAIDLPVECDYMAVSSYGKGTKSSGTVRIVKDLDTDITNRHLLIAEDVVDSGLTLARVIEMLKSRGAASVEVAALLHKHLPTAPPCRYEGFPSPEEFLVGYGLDYAEKYRNLPYIGILKPEVYGG